MVRYIVDTSRNMEVVSVYAELTEYNMVKCTTKDGREIFVESSKCFKTKEEAFDYVQETKYIINFKRKHKDKKHNAWKCCYCGRILYNKKEVTVDHLVPKSKGGKTEWSNLAICCKSCNGIKSSKHKYHYIKLMKKSSKIKLNNPKKYDGKIKKVAYKRHDVDMESIARSDSNIISMNGIQLWKPKENMVDKVLREYNQSRR